MERLKFVKFQFLSFFFVYNKAIENRKISATAFTKLHRPTRYCLVPARQVPRNPEPRILQVKANLFA